MDQRRRYLGVVAGRHGRDFAGTGYTSVRARTNAEGVADALREHRGIFGLRRDPVSAAAGDDCRAGAAPQRTQRHSAADPDSDGHRPASAATTDGFLQVAVSKARRTSVPLDHLSVDARFRYSARTSGPE